MRFLPRSWFLFIVLVIFLFILVSGCSDTPEPVKPDSSRSSEEIEARLYPISLQEGLIKTGEVLIGEELGKSSTLPVYFIQAKRIDSEGKAEQWIFGVRNDNENTFVIVQSNRQILAPYPSELPEKEVISSQIVDPATLIGKNKKLFIQAGGREPLILPELELSGGVYTITVSTGSGNTVFLFNASDGNPTR